MTALPRKARTGLHEWAQQIESEGTRGVSVYGDENAESGVRLKGAVNADPNRPYTKADIATAKRVLRQGGAHVSDTYADNLLGEAIARLRYGGKP